MVLLNAHTPYPGLQDVKRAGFHLDWGPTLNLSALVFAGRAVTRRREIVPWVFAYAVLLITGDKVACNHERGIESSASKQHGAHACASEI